jgi:hypothetical protein
MSDSRIKQNDAQENLLLLNRILITYKSALAEWYKGNPYEYLTLYSQDDYTYFDPVHEKRIEGYEEIKNFYDEIKGLVSCNDYEIRNPRIQKGKDIAVLRFANEKDWNIIHSHWAYALPAELLKTGDTNII